MQHHLQVIVFTWSPQDPPLRRCVLKQSVAGNLGPGSEDRAECGTTAYQKNNPTALQVFVSTAPCTCRTSSSHPAIAASKAATASLEFPSYSSAVPRSKSDPGLSRSEVTTTGSAAGGALLLPSTASRRALAFCCTAAALEPSPTAQGKEHATRSIAARACMNRRAPSPVVVMLLNLPASVVLTGDSVLCGEPKLGKEVVANIVCGAPPGKPATAHN